MVKQLSLFIMLLSFSSCGLLSSIWHASPPARKNVVITGEPLPPFVNVFSDDLKTSDSTLEAWHQNLSHSFSQIQGRKDNFLSAAEIETLVLSGFVKLDENKEISAKRVKAILEVMGFKEGISLEQVHQIFDWLKTHRETAKAFYRSFISQEMSNANPSSHELIQAIDFLGSLLVLTGDQAIEVEHLNELFLPWIPEKFSHAKKGLKSGIELGISFFSSFCGDRVDAKAWNGKRIGVCLNDLSRHFEGSTPAFDYLFGNRNPLIAGEELKRSGAELPRQVASWLQDHHHPIFKTARVSDFAKALDIPPPYAFFDLMAWLPKLNPDSTADGFSPSFFIDIAGLLNQWIQTSVDVTANEKCKETNWKECAFQGTYEPVDSLYTDEYASLIRAKNLGFVRKIALYDSLSQFVMGKFDIGKSGKLDGDIKELINIAIRLLDTNAFAQNVMSRALEKPFDPSNTEDSLKSIGRQGLSELAAYAADLIPSRAKNRRGFLKGLEAQIVPTEKKIPYTLDQLGITTFLYLYDLINGLRQDYLDHYSIPVRVQGPLLYVKRRTVVETLPRILYDHFPLIYNECLREGFERTCGVVYTEVLPNADEGKDEIETYEMDVITLTSILLESMMMRCDRNGDDALSSNPFDGFDEKHCMVTVSSALAKRLINSNIVKQNDTAELLMLLVKRVPFFRWAAKSALSRGTLKGIGLFGLPPLTLFSGPASLGSVMSLAAEFMASDKVKAIETGVEGPISNPGEELIYLKRLSLSHLPSQSEAPRAKKTQINR